MVTEKELRAIQVAGQRRVIRLFAAVGVVLVIFIVIVSIALANLYTTVQENRDLAHRNEVISMQNQLILTKKLADAEYQKTVDASLKTQLINLVTRLSAQVKALGGDPGLTTITAPTTTTTKPPLKSPPTTTRVTTTSCRLVVHALKCLLP